MDSVDQYSRKLHGDNLILRNGEGKLTSFLIRFFLLNVGLCVALWSEDVLFDKSKWIFSGAPT